MDSPESSKPANTNSETAIPQDSPVFLYMSNLSPLPPVKAPSLAPGFQGLNSPPPVFTSPEPNRRSQLAFLKSKQVSTPSVVELPGSNRDGKNTRLENSSDSDIPVDDLINTPTESHQQSLIEIANVASVDPNFSFNSTIEKSEYSDQPPDAASKEILVKPESKDNTRISEEIVVVRPVIDGQTEENIAVGKATSLDDCSHLSLGTIKVGNENANFLNFTEAALIEPFQVKVKNHPEAFQYRGLQRRLQFDDSEHEVISNQPAQNPSDIEGPESLSVEMPEMLINRKLDEVFQPLSYPRNSSNTTKIPKPSGDERKRTEKDGGASEEFNMTRAGIERTKSLDSGGSDCFTHCNCKKTKCLKLYCDCFAAAMHCAELCSCKECFNRPEHEDKVREACKKIKSRDPLAFAPKVVQGTIAQPGSSRRMEPLSHLPHRGIEEGAVVGNRCVSRSTAYVGCSDKCLCVGCKNSFGQGRALDQESRHHNVEKGESSSLSGGPNLHGWVDSSKAQLFSSRSSLGWHSSAVIPRAQFGKTKVLRDVKFDGELSNILQDDVTPEILKNTSIPLNAVKVSSPKKKRVSPPHAPHEFGSSSSAGRRPRVLVSPFPPLAPCADFKTDVDEQANGPQKQSNNKRDQNL